MPKNWNRYCPEIVNAERMINATKVALRAMAWRSSFDSPSVMDRKMGIVPKGFTSVKKEVKQSSAKGMMLSIANRID